MKINSTNSKKEYPSLNITIIDDNNYILTITTEKYNYLCPELIIGYYKNPVIKIKCINNKDCLLYTSPSPRDS